MASVHRRPASKFWHAFFLDGEGRLIDKSTRLKDRKRAQRVAETLETAARRKKSAQNVRTAFGQIFQDTYQETMSVATFRSYAAQWLKTKKPEAAVATLQSCSKTISAFMDFLGSKADRDLSDVARADLIAFRNSLTEKLSSTSINRYISVLRMVFKTAKRDGYVLENPVEFVELVRKDRTEGRRAAVADPEWQSLIKFGLYTGQRLGGSRVNYLGEYRSGTPGDSFDDAQDGQKTPRPTKRCITYSHLKTASLRESEGATPSPQLRNSRTARKIGFFIQSVHRSARKSRSADKPKPSISWDRT